MVAIESCSASVEPSLRESVCGKSNSSRPALTSKMGASARAGDRISSTGRARSLRRSHLADRLCGLDGHGTLLHNDLGRLGDAGDHACRALPEREVRCLTCAHALRLCWRVDGDEHAVRLRDPFLRLSAEEQVLATRGLDHLQGSSARLLVRVRLGLSDMVDRRSKSAMSEAFERAGGLRICALRM